jgi:hypothetical protein
MNLAMMAVFATGNAAPMVLTVATPDGQKVSSLPVTIAVQ